MATNFPNGVASYGLPLLPSIGGAAPNAGSAAGNVGPTNVYFVSSVYGADGNSGKGMKSGYPLATLKQALALALPGDTIILMPGHVENITSAAFIDVTTSNIQVIGLGTGNQRPLLVFKTATTATFRINSATGDGFYMYNVRVQSQIANLAVCFVVAAKDVTFDTVDYYDDGTNDVATMFQVTGINCQIRNCYWELEIANASTLQWITLNAAQGFRCYNNYGFWAGKSSGNPANGAIVGVTALTKHVDIRGNTFVINAGGTSSVVISLLASSTGFVAYNNLFSVGKTALAGTNALASAVGAQNFCGHTANKNGILDPVADA